MGGGFTAVLVGALFSACMVWTSSLCKSLWACPGTRIRFTGTRARLGSQPDNSGKGVSRQVWLFVLSLTVPVMLSYKNGNGSWSAQG